ncbi:hypothetical protein PAXRUDRAFT_505892 [Paxillus rubicundulus Ve08.2h10]|uniref:DNA replication regulator Sld3 C-terminal domain-containing protein n=1 Tax=Paxillus rubicundulus Ve08.2h10 TaxID=930991 RepID=A0A0D0DLM5_9AGAM|nr:hypothetical protein PAXRUDRAFT_505892 [Paxillus rubicundulus Ve08.2h10]
MNPIQALTLLTTSSAKWTATQEKTINREYPFTDIHHESPDQFVVRTYLQFLWLPESIMPLHLLVPSLRRVQDVPSRAPDVPHPLHALLDPLLLSARSSAAKYHVELPQILADNGGAGEAEESMMWFASNYEKMGTDEEEAEGAHSEDAVMMEEKSRNKWLERLEQREVQVQILLYCLKLSIPGPCAPLPPVTIVSSSTDPIPSTKKKRRKERPKSVIPSPTERLESFMDKLSTWQLVSLMDGVHKHTERTPDQRDWMQIFCEQVVERQFKSTLPELCALLRSKLFPHSLFDDDVDAIDPLSSPSSPRADPNKAFPAAESSKGVQRSSSVLSHTASSESGKRSRSLSVSLAQDASNRRTTSSTSSSLKRALSREVSMLRAFKPRAQAAPKDAETSRCTQAQLAVPKSNSRSTKQASSGIGVTLVATTPTKPKNTQRARSYTASETRSTSPSLGMCVDDGDQSDTDEARGFKEEDEEMWLPDSSPDILLLGHRKRTASASSSLGPSDGDGSMAVDTPPKKRKRV